MIVWLFWWMVWLIPLGEMPVPVWDCSDLGLLGEPLDTATVVSDDIWKKFDLPDFLSIDHRVDTYSEMHYDRTFDDGVLSDSQYDKTCLSREIRHHDCMWAGLCISKEHNRTLPAMKDSLIQKKVPAGRSVLISRANTAYIGTSLAVNQQQAQQMCRARNLESDGESTRPETPQSSSSDTETEDEGPFFRHDQINIHEKLSECISVPATKAVRVSQNKRKTGRRGRRKEQDQCQMHRETNIRNTLSDHCYHLNQSFSKNLEHLGVQTPSDSGESRFCFPSSRCSLRCCFVFPLSVASSYSYLTIYIILLYIIYYIYKYIDTIHIIKEISKIPYICTFS